MGTDTIPDSMQKSQDLSYTVSAGSNMDSLVLEDILIDKESKWEINPEQGMANSESKTTVTSELGVDNEYNFDLKSEEKQKKLS